MGMITIRPATAADVERVAEIMYGAPGGEPVGLFGSVEAARRFGIGTVRLEGVTDPARPVVVAERDGRVVGMLQFKDEPGPGSGITFAHARLALRVLGPLGVLRLLPRLRARARVDLPIPPGARLIHEVHVDPACRGEGIGGALLDWVESDAQRLGIDRLALTTAITNPARRLYERKGSVVTQTATDARYERYTGGPGRVLMEKPL